LVFAPFHLEKSIDSTFQNTHFTFFSVSVANITVQANIVSWQDGNTNFPAGLLALKLIANTPSAVRVISQKHIQMYKWV
jgi:hypothetical protein